MSANQYAADELTKRQIQLLRNVNAEIRKLKPYLVQMIRLINKALTRNDITGFNKTRLRTLKREINRIIAGSIKLMSTEMKKDMNRLAKSEAVFTQSMINEMVSANVAKASIAGLTSALAKSKMTLISGKTKQQLTIDEAILVFTKSTMSNVTNSIASGLVAGETTDQIVKEVTRVVKSRTSAQAQAMIRTVANHTTAMSRLEVYKENDDILLGEIFIATLDSHTTLQCSANDQKRFPVGKGAYPPLLYNCRSVRIPEVDPAFTIAGLEGDRPSIGANNKVTIEDGRTTFNSFLRRQPASFQDEYFSQFKDGAEKAKLFRNGGLGIQNFVNSNNIEYSIGQLEKMNPNQWKRANL